MTNSTTFEMPIKAVLKMDPEVKARWVEALRSGKYTQVKGALRTPEGCNCCLGVLAELEGITYRPYDKTKDVAVESGDKENLWFDFGQDGTIAGNVPYGFCGLGMDRFDLIRMNDDEGKTFPEIADYIEKNL